MQFACPANLRASGATPTSGTALLAPDRGVFFDYPVGKDNGLTAQADFIRYDGGATFPTAALFKQDDLYLESGFFMGGLKIMPFLRYEIQKYQDDVNQKLNHDNFQVGLG